MVADNLQFLQNEMINLHHIKRNLKNEIKKEFRIIDILKSTNHFRFYKKLISINHRTMFCVSHFIQ